MPSTSLLRASAAFVIARWASSSKCGPEIRRNISTPRSTSSSPGVRFNSFGAWRKILRWTLPCLRSPVFDMIDVRLATRPGCSMAIVWAIMPPIDMPTTWARATPRWSSSPMPSSAMSFNRYVGWAARRETRLSSTSAGRRRLVLVVGRQPDVPVVVADDAERTGRGQLLDELVRPPDELAAQAHHEQEHRCVVVAVDVVLDRDAVGRCRSHGAADYGPVWSASSSWGW